MNKERLLNVARACRETKFPDRFNMGTYSWICGTPACAIGNYAARADLQDEFTLDRLGNLNRNDGDYYGSSSLEEHFGVGRDAAYELFGSRGCGNAKTAIEAAEYIEAFVARGGE